MSAVTETPAGRAETPALPCTRQEMMAVAAGREIRDGELAIFGVGLSMLAGYFAQACHAPNVRAMTEGGV